MSLAEVCEQAMQKDGVVGVMCVDTQGLCLHSAGAVPEGKAGMVAAISAQCRELLGADAVATVESTNGKVLLSHCEEAAVALFMQQSA
jgi:hypothetical protein